MKQEDFVTYEQAVKLKELGFDWECRHWYFNPTRNKVFICIHDCFDYKDMTRAPSLALAAKWLRTENNLCVCSFCKIDRRGRYKYQWMLTFLKEDKSVTPDDIFFDTYEEALSAGIDKALELIKEK